eukprot:3568979-Rhodomonas_salina.1
MIHTPSSSSSSSSSSPHHHHHHHHRDDHHDLQAAIAPELQRTDARIASAEGECGLCVFAAHAEGLRLCRI